MDLKVSQMVPIATSELIPDRPNIADIYVRLSDKKFVLLYKKGDSAARDRLKNYSLKKEVANFWVEKNQFHQFTLRNISLAGVGIKSDLVNTKQKTLLLFKAVDCLFTEMQFLGISPHTFLRAKTLTDLTIYISTHNFKLRHYLLALSEFNNDLCKRAIATSIIAVMTGQQLDLTSKSNQQCLALGALLQDAGMTQLPKKLQTLNFEDMNNSEKQLYYSHPTIGRNLTEQIEGLDKDVLEIIYQHEELPDGSGFPQQLKKLHIHPLSEIVILAKLFAELTIKNRFQITPMPISHAINYLNNKSRLPFNMKTLRALIKAVQKNNT